MTSDRDSFVKPVKPARRRAARLTVPRAAILLALGVYVLSGCASSSDSAATTSASTTSASTTSASTTSASTTSASTTSAYGTTLDYVVRFFPRFITYWLDTNTPKNRLVSPVTPPSGVIGPSVRLIVLPNIDTVYALCQNVDLSQGPLILTVPATTVSWSLQTLDVWGTDFTTDISNTKAGVYGLVLPGYNKALPQGVTKIVVPYPNTTWYLRANRYTNNAKTVSAAKAFVGGIRLASLADYEADPNRGRVVPLPQGQATTSSKVVSDTTLADAPTTYLKELQVAMQSASTAPLSQSDRSLSSAFDSVFAAAQNAQDQGDYEPMSQIVNGAHAAYAMIVNHYQSHTVGGSEWIHFQDVANWGTNYLDRAATTEYMIQSNTAATAVYYNAFTDDQGSRLDSGINGAYRITFSKEQIPQNTRFWSLTLYVSDAITLFAPQYPRVPTKNVAEYTPGLVTDPDGSITIYIQPNPPRDAARMPNWLPTPPTGPFSVMLRVYSPTGNTATGNYVPPEIKQAP
jgi:hypothetical protein